MADDKTPIPSDADLPAPEESSFFASESQPVDDGAVADTAPEPQPEAAATEPAPELDAAPEPQPSADVAPATDAAAEPSPAEPAGDLGDTLPQSPLPEQPPIDPASAEQTQLMAPVQYDPQAGQYTQVVPVVAADQTIEAIPPLLTPTVPMVTAGSRVIIVVSRGPSQIPPAAVTGVPHVVAMSQGEALSQLQQAGLSAQVFNEYSELPRGEVLGQEPPFGATAPIGSEVVLLVSGGPAPAATLAVPLPNVVGLSEADALARLQQSGLSPQVVRDFSANVPLGVVIAQLPSGQQIAEEPVKRASLWWLWLLLVVSVLFASAGGVYYYLNRTAAVPNLVGLSQSQAEQAIVAAGFKLGSIGTTQTLSASQVGKVTTQTPSPNTQARMIDQVSIIVGGGQKLFIVPDVTGKPQAEARSELTSAGLQVSVTQAYSATVPTDSVISQSPGAGEQVPNGTTVGITVSSGRQTTGSTIAPPSSTTPQVLVSVPTVTGKTQASAQSALTAAGLVYTVSQQNDAKAKGIVIGQLPGGGTSVASGSQVAITISLGPAPVNMIDLSGLLVSTAKKDVAKVPLGSTVLSYKTLASTKLVLGQYPANGTSLAPKTKVLIVGSSGVSAETTASPASTVPDVMGAHPTYKTAKTALAKEHLLSQIFYWSGSGQPAGHVVYQIPAEGTKLPRNAKVVLIIAK